MINTLKPEEWVVVCLQEPWLDHRWHNTGANHHWHVLYPSTHYTNPASTRSVIFVLTRTAGADWQQLKIDCANITAAQFRGDAGVITLFNIYNDCSHSRSLQKLSSFMQTYQPVPEFRSDDPGQDDPITEHVVWCGDFNRHHPDWDEESDTLFTREAIDKADELIATVADFGMEMALPGQIPTLQHMVTKKWSRPDNVFCTEHTLPLITECSTRPQERPVGTGHIPIVTILNVTAQELATPT